MSELLPHILVLSVLLNRIVAFLISGTLLTMYNCFGINLIDVRSSPDESREANRTTIKSTLMEGSDITARSYPPIRSTEAENRRFMTSLHPVFRQRERDEFDKDVNLKNKIATLVQQAIHDTKVKMKTIDDIKAKYKDDPSYKVGFIFNNLKKSKDVMNELFNVAVKHRHDWKALEQMKIFELIVHTNVDTTNLVRQVVELHLHHMNSTDPVAFKKRVVLL